MPDASQSTQRVVEDPDASQGMMVVGGVGLASVAAGFGLGTMLGNRLGKGKKDTSIPSEPMTL